MKIAVIIAAAVILSAAAVMLFFRKTEAEAEPVSIDTSEQVMFLDYYEKPMAVVGPAGYYELVISGYSDTEVMLDEYTTQTEDGSEIRTTYIVPAEALDRGMKVVRKYRMDTWNDHDDYFGITGKLFVCRFRSDSGEYCRVTSEHMPDDGKSVFAELYNILTEYLCEEYLVKQ